MNSKVLSKHFRAYFGIGALIGFNTIKSAKRNTISQWILVSRTQTDSFTLPVQKSIPINGYYRYTSLSAYLPLGLKYNLSCDFNLFSEFKLGLQFEPIAEKGQHWMTFISIGLGLRYKFISAEKQAEEPNSFW